MNKLKKVSIIFIFACLILGSNVYAATAKINVSAARLRDEANTTSNVLTKIYKNEKVEILGSEGDWYKVKYGKNTGYLKKDLVTEVVEEKKEESVSESTYNSETTTNVGESSKIKISNTTSVRYAPNFMSSSIIKVEAGRELTKVSELGKWVQVTDNIFSGWVLKSKTNIQNNQQQVDSSSFETPSKNNTVTNTVKESSTVSNKTNTSNTTNTNKTTNDVNSSNTTNSVNSNKVNNNTTNNSSNTATAVNKKGKVNVETAKVREKANSTAKVIGFLDYNDVIEITAEDGDWYKFTEKDVSGYVHKTLVTLVEENISSRGTTAERKPIIEETAVDNTKVNSETNETLNENFENTTNAVSNGQSVVDYAKQYVGYPYVVGGKNPSSGFDCSGFTRYVFLNFGYSLGATAATQNNLGVEVARENLMPGDLILFYDEGKTKIGHTGIYISNGDFVHAANPTRGVVIDNINTNSYYNERYIIARRIVE